MGKRQGNTLYNIFWFDKFSTLLKGNPQIFLGQGLYTKEWKGKDKKLDGKDNKSWNYPQKAL